ncbi:hypothetical protein [Cellulomonas endometrii]|uniref:hypothetical protein n=1 Tax=Cellulomonas endometrii TaxID=3036301 RepID=UPI0024AE85AE|nr:hypothetical protein [Cellulomonas endometrii]
MRLRKVTRRGGIVAGLVAGILAMGAAPSFAYGSSLWNEAPTRCSGSYLGSSSPNGSNTVYTSTGPNTSTCVLTRPQYGAAPRYSGITVSANYSNSFVTNVGAWRSDALGGRHLWGNISNVT